MSRLKLFLAMGLVATFACVAAAPAAWSETATTKRPLHSKVTPAEKSASDALINQGLTQLTAAQTADNGGNLALAVSDLQSAVATMKQALPIYQGYRVKAMRQADRAIRQLSHPKAASKAPAAIADANTALQKSASEVTETE
ncbi:MAG: hypothetical protein P4L33_01425 [Capsulimonadaceae bacterium]|nr:hypothetical protein [Capsulimonadaceae bacterium]